MKIFVTHSSLLLINTLIGDSIHNNQITLFEFEYFANCNAICL